LVIEGFHSPRLKTFFFDRKNLQSAFLAADADQIMKTFAYFLIAAFLDTEFFNIGKWTVHKSKIETKRNRFTIRLTDSQFCDKINIL